MEFSDNGWISDALVPERGIKGLRKVLPKAEPSIILPIQFYCHRDSLGYKAVSHLSRPLGGWCQLVYVPFRVSYLS